VTVGRVLALVLSVAALAVVGVHVATARTSQSVPTTGIVDVETNLAYQNGEAAGTGMVLTPSGKVLTNNHVIRGATTITVLVPSTHKRYAARVVGYAVTADVALLQLKGASGLATVSLGNSSHLTRGQAVSAIGNAGGTRTLSTTTGTITGLARTITVSDDLGGSERLSGLIETDASLEPGDSGGPLLDSSGRVIGMDTAASAGFRFRGATDGYAIPIGRARAIANQIAAGRASAQVHVGNTAFLGVSLQSNVVARIVSGSPVARAGIVAGDMLTHLNGRPIASSADVIRALLPKHPGDTVTLAWADGAGLAHSASITLASGPPQ
jgi:S1-C subfamily serine protease